ncbi:lycopene cyclase [Marivirga lumbricoides]|uniref:Lycopene cyclase n=2 Tax=Marivirga lumbricoides TaxID=1046115 RepID=A0ABQ1N4L7_9BACT|nr:lycopene cyclase [Marivirga lumbricoides]
MYDYVIGGAGLAGLTLAWKMVESGILSGKTLLIIEPDNKSKNDRTWSFWNENEPWLTQLPTLKKWNEAEIWGHNYHKIYTLNPFSYYKIEGKEFYEFAKLQIQSCPNITWLKDSVIGEDANSQQVFTPTHSFRFKEYFFKNYFNSSLLPSLNGKGKHFIWQHFLGWTIRTKTEQFKPDVITYMDMRVPAIEKGLSFAYILPTSETEALVEYTLFSADLWEKNAYQKALVNYIEQILGISEYKILDEEFNKIPMTNAVFAKREKNIIPIGTLAGTVKPSTGYSFIRNFRHVQKIIRSLLSGSDDFSIDASLRFKFYDEVLINVLKTGKADGQQVFQLMYEQNDLRLLFRFLNEETSLLQDLKIMNSVPKMPFVKAVWEELL